MENNRSKVQITELFCAKAGLGLNGFNRCFYGTLFRKVDSDDNTIYYGKIHVKYYKHDGYIYAKANNDIELRDKLDSLVIMILDKNLHDSNGVYFKRYGFQYYLN